MNELVSIIVPVYNGELEVENMIAALKKQSYSNLEFVVIDDGSEDCTLQKCLEYTCDDSRFRIFHKENGGVSSARNAGINYAQGEYITFLDADDYIFPNYVSYLHQNITKYNADISCCDYIKVQKNKKKNITKKNKVRSDKIFSQQEAINNLLYRYDMSASAWGKLYRRSILKDVYFPEGIAYSEDFFFVMRALLKSCVVVYSTQSLYVYIQNSQSAVHNMRLEGMKKTWELYQSNILANTELVNQYGMALYVKGMRMALEFLAKLPCDSSGGNFENAIWTYIHINKNAILKDDMCKYSDKVLAFCCVNKVFVSKMLRIYFEVKNI